MKEQRRFYDIAYASAKECKTIIELALPETHPLAEHIDSLAAHLYKLRLQLQAAPAGRRSSTEF